MSESLHSSSGLDLLSMGNRFYFRGGRICGVFPERESHMIFGGVPGLESIGRRREFRI